MPSDTEIIAVLEDILALLTTLEEKYGRDADDIGSR